MLAKNLQNILTEVQGSIGQDDAYSYAMSKEIKQQFKKMKKDFKKCKKIAARNEHYFFALEHRINNAK